MQTKAQEAGIGRRAIVDYLFSKFLPLLAYQVDAASSMELVRHWTKAAACDTGDMLNLSEFQIETVKWNDRNFRQTKCDIPFESDYDDRWFPIFVCFVKSIFIADVSLPGGTRINLHRFMRRSNLRRWGSKSKTRAVTHASPTLTMKHTKTHQNIWFFKVYM